MNLTGIDSKLMFILILIFVATLVLVAIIVKSALNSRKNRQERKSGTDSFNEYLLNISYAFRTNMNAIIGYTNLAREHIDDSEKATKYLDKITESSNAIMKIIASLPYSEKDEEGSDAMLSATPVSANPKKDGNEPFTTRDLMGKRALVVDDVELNRELTKELLEEYGMIVEDAPDGEKAVEMCKNKMDRPPEENYDMILMDIQMPGMNGYETARKIRELPKNEANAIPIIALTVNFMDVDKKKAYDSGMNAYVIKPLHVNELLEAIGRSLVK